MKQTRSLVTNLLAVGVVLAMVASAAAQSYPTRTAKVVRVSGTARYTVDGGATFKPLAPGMILRPGSVIQTAATERDAYVDVVLGDGSVALPAAPAPSSVIPRGGAASINKARQDMDIIHIHGNTTLALDKLSATDAGGVIVSETELDLRKGRITGNVKKMTAGSTYSIRYPTGVAAIRGSVYDMALVENIENGTVKVVLTMENGSAVVSFKGPNGNIISQTVLPMSTFSDGTVGPASQQLLDAIALVLSEAGIPPITISRVLYSDQTIIQVTGTTGQGSGGSTTP